MIREASPSARRDAVRVLEPHAIEPPDLQTNAQFGKRLMLDHVHPLLAEFQALSDFFKSVPDAICEAEAQAQNFALARLKLVNNPSEIRPRLLAEQTTRRSGFTCVGQRGLHRLCVGLIPADRAEGGRAARVLQSMSHLPREREPQSSLNVRAESGATLCGVMKQRVVEHVMGQG